MAAENFDRAFSAVLKHEGGYVDHPQDPGGATNLGVTIGTLSGWLGRQASKAEVRALTPEKVKPIYRQNYWNRVRGDDLPGGVDYAVFDYAVNSGPKRAAQHLQEVLGVKADGVIGPVTLTAARARRPLDLIEALCDRRMRFLRGLSTFATFGRGWANRVNGVRTLAAQMASEAPIRPDVPAPQPGAQPGSAPPNRSLAIAIFILALALVGAFFILTR